MAEFIPGSDYVQDNGDGTYTTVVDGTPIFTGSKSGAEAAFRNAKGGGGKTAPTGGISDEHRDGLRRAGYPDWANPNLTEADFARISAGAAKGGAGAGVSAPGSLDILPTEQMRLAIELANQEYLRKRLEQLEIPEMMRRTEQERHQLALDAATQFAQISGYYAPRIYLEKMIGDRNPGLVPGTGDTYQTVNGIKTLAEMEQELKNAGWPGGEDVATAYARTTNSPVTKATQPAQQPQQPLAPLPSPLGVGGQAGGTGGGVAAQGVMTAQGGDIVPPIGDMKKIEKTARYNTATGVKTVQQMEDELKVANWPGPNPGEDPIQAILDAYSRTTNKAVTPFVETPAPSPGQPGVGAPGGGGLPPLTIDQLELLPTFERQKYITDLAANPRNLVQTLLMLGMSLDQIPGLLSSLPFTNQLLNQGGWNIDPSAGLPTPYNNPINGMPGPATGQPSPVGGVQPGMIYDPGGPPGALPLPTIAPNINVQPGPDQMVALGNQQGGDGLVSALSQIMQPNVGGTTMPTDNYGYPDNFGQYQGGRRGDEGTVPYGTPFDWKSWIQNNPWRRQNWGQTSYPQPGQPPVYPSPWPSSGGGNNEQVSAMGGTQQPQMGVPPGGTIANWGYDANGNRVNIPGTPNTGGQPYVPPAIQNIMRQTPLGDVGTRNPAFPFITGRQLPVRSTLNWMDTNSPMIKLLQGLFSFSGQEPGNAFSEFQSFLPKGAPVGPTTY